MISVTLAVLRTIAAELPPGVTSPTFTVDHIIAKIWDRNWKELREGGFTPHDLRAIAVGAWNYAESTGWSNIRKLVQEPAADGGSLLDRKSGLARAGILDLPSGRWAWIAPEHDGFIHVSLQMIGRPTERMEGAVRAEDFTAAQVERIARDPSIRWWWDRANEVTWEIRTVLRLAPPSARELTFSHATLGSRSVPIGEDVWLGELSDGALQRLLKRAEAPAPELSREENGLSATA